MSDFGTGFGAVGNGSSVRGPVPVVAPSRALLRAASRSRLLAGAGTEPASRRGPKISSADFAGVGEPGVAAGADDDGAGVRLRSAGGVVAGGAEVVFGAVLGSAGDAVEDTAAAGAGATFGTTVGGT